MRSSAPIAVICVPFLMLSANKMGEEDGVVVTIKLQLEVMSSIDFVVFTLKQNSASPP